MAETLATLQEELALAKAARGKLLRGEAVAEWQDSNGERVRYQQANRGALSTYISDLERKIAILMGENSSVKPMRVFL